MMNIFIDAMAVGKSNWVRMTLTNSSGSGSGEALQRQMRRRVEEDKLQSIHTCAPASELYWAIVALLIDDGTVNTNVLRREAPDKRTLELVDKASNRSATRSG